jgi:pSer/pThr/pTyr-binding forkhead associated (FHA) protein
MAKIHVLLAGQKLGTYPMSATPWIVGRHNTCHVQIDNAGVSRRHCRFTYDDGAYHVEDMQSANGVFIKGQKVRRAPVENGTEVGIGKYVLIFEDTGLELPPGQGGAVARKPAGGQVGFSGAQRTFQVDSQTLKEQIAKAGAAAADVSAGVVKKAADVAKAFDQDSPLEIKKRRDVWKYVAIGMKIFGIAVLAAVVALGIYFAMMS